MLLIEARNQRAMSSADLARLIGVDVLQPFDPDAALEVPGAAASASDRLVTEARAQRDERRALELRIEAADEQRAAARGVRLSASPGVAPQGSWTVV